MKKIFYLSLILLTGIFAACKKDKKTNTNVATKNGTTLDLIKDSVYLYTKEDYLWFDQLPSYATFNPRAFTASTDFLALSKEMDALSQYAINPNTGKPYEYVSYSPGQAKYSFVDDGTETSALNGVKGDFGFDYNYQGVNDIRIEYVYPGSPAANAGLTRGCQITSVNNNSNISYDGSGYGTGSNAHNNLVYNAIFNASTLTMTVTKLNGTSANVTISTASYTVNPVLKDTVLDLGSGHKLGYIVFNSFTSDDNADSKLDAAFTSFSTAGVTDVAVDLRYNGGGYVSTAEYLDNLIVPASGNNSLMYSTTYNSTLTSGKDVLLKNQVYSDSNGLYTLADVISQLVANNTVNFVKKGNLAANRVFFIVTGGTASASELTINNLRPKMDVQLVGDTTYGKPVGFFGLNINKYVMYTPEFATVNSANQGGYFAGMTPGTGGYNGYEVYDDYTKDFGDPSEVLLSHVINYIQKSTYSTSTKVVQNLVESNQPLALQHSNAKTFRATKPHFNGMVFNKRVTANTIHKK
ncbi:S41 family peptidase [Mucilaginibacter sp.]|uniref:S41 family peptidase n=1 Tax=Mucilaginibacter sp. TaxID=1882438 RepID=UPI003D11C5B2